MLNKLYRYLLVFNTLLLKLDDPLKRLPERDWRVIVVVEVYLMRQVGGGVQKTVELALHLTSSLIVSKFFILLLIT